MIVSVAAVALIMRALEEEMRIASELTNKPPEEVLSAYGVRIAC